LRHFKFLRQVYYVGGNEEAARFSGINVDRVRSFTYIVTGVLAAAAGVVNSSRLISASANAGERAELRVISAAVIGGASLSGGAGTILGAFLGLLLVGVIENGMEILGVNIYMKNIILGSILILAVTIDRINRDMIKRFLYWLKK
jgi:ribose transport system permease protein